ncbi:M3 family metallopeptidase [Arcanobacterium pinnipediorum]|uniref:M3 family metallopeptidase n=1 Tax=Arcanobacterium pinnipediorum TaxID=1503041 RepID=A0ABY5AGK4_9ACTO|nr:M3 family metallopeptidase [Arcanobacterium pinnipediorum]USR78851.1 M3 family metallopeptidase [Arcanobacterium pinnipediorum]
MSENPLLKKSSLPFQLPNWQAIKPEHIIPAVDQVLAHQRQAWEKIATDTAAPTVANTIEAIEHAGEEFDRVLSIAFTLFSSIGTEELDEIEAAIGPKLAEHESSYLLDKRIYERLLALDVANEDAETQYWLEKELKAFRSGGIELDGPAADRLRKIDTKLSSLQIEYTKRATRAMADAAYVVNDPAQLAGLDEEKLESLRTEDGSYRIELANFSNQPIQAEITDPHTRRTLLNASLERGSGKYPEADTRELVREIAALRAERARLLGYQNHSQVVAAREMAGDSAAIGELLTSVAHKAVAAVERDAQRLAELAEADPSGDGLQAGDWSFYEEQLRAQQGVEEAKIMPYLELNNVVEKGIFFAAERLFGITFEPRNDLAGYVPTMQTWEVKDADGSSLGLFQADFFRRPGKKGGAWMHSVITGCELDGTKPVILNNCNFTEPGEGEPCLLTWDNVETVFHEFGHALHGLLTKTHYRASAGTNVPRDFVELPSQLNEMWAYHPEVLASYARHHETGEVMPEELVSALASSKTFGQAFATTEFTKAALLDQAWHLLSEDQIPDDVEAFEAQALEDFGVSCPLVPPRYRSTYFPHTFGGGYDAGYYSYMWAEVLVADIEQWFREGSNGGFTREAGMELREKLLSRGSSRPPMESFVAVRGREPRAGALLERRGL